MEKARLWESYVDYTKNLTEHSRKLAFGAAGICWFFKSPDITFPRHIQWALFFIVVFFICDLLHYVGAAISLRIYLEREEDKHWKSTGKEATDVLKPRWVDYAASVFALIKTIMLLIAFGYLIGEFNLRLSAPAQPKPVPELKAQP